MHRSSQAAADTTTDSIQSKSIRSSRLHRDRYHVSYHSIMILSQASAGTMRSTSPRMTRFPSTSEQPAATGGESCGTNLTEYEGRVETAPQILGRCEVSPPAQGLAASRPGCHLSSLSTHRIAIRFDINITLAGYRHYLLIRQHLMGFVPQRE